MLLKIPSNSVENLISVIYVFRFFLLNLTKVLRTLDKNQYRPLSSQTEDGRLYSVFTPPILLHDVTYPYIQISLLH